MQIGKKKKLKKYVHHRSDMTLVKERSDEVVSDKIGTA